MLLPLSVIGLVLPRFTRSSAGPTFSPLQSVILVVMSVGLYAVFLAIQTRRHREYFVAPGTIGNHAPAQVAAPASSARGHLFMMLAYAIPIVILTKQIGAPIDHGINGLGAPGALGGLLVAVLILSSESLAAVRAARDNQLQRAINLTLGAALSSISLTIPAVLIIGFITGREIVLGLDPAPMVLLLLTLAVSMLTFA